MALGKQTFEIFKQILTNVSHRPLKLVTVGYPDCLVSEDYIGNAFGKDILPQLTFREDSKDILSWHNLESRLERVIETEALFDLIGIEMTVLDITKVRGDEVVCDLNEPVPQDLENAFDIVYDGGAMEHCFNIGQVIKNFVVMAKVDGVVVHNNPLVVMNHGFFNFNPTFYYDYYKDNGHELISPIYGVVSDGLDYKVFDLPPISRFSKAPDNSWLCVVARKCHDRPNTWPVQSKYKIEPMQAAKIVDIEQ